VDAAIAVGVFLAFHRVRDAVESRLQALFFRRWHDNEKRLRRFVEEASFITRADNLKTAFVEEFARFTGGATVGLYLHDGQTDYRAIGATPSADTAVLDRNDPVLVALRANRRPIDPADTTSSLGPGLALPMLHRKVLLGLVLLGSKPSGDAYRPDEVEVLAYAAHHVGLDLHALKVERLEREGAELSREVRRLESEVARLQSNGSATAWSSGTT
jgi:GAF domain-containing protein